MMKKIKDVFYNMNDILVAVVIVALAAFVIVSNIDSILAYPSSIAEDIKVPEQETPTDYAENPASDEPESGDDTTDQQGSTDSDSDQQSPDGGGVSGQEGTAGQQNSDGEKVENYAVYINSGSTGAQIADILIEVGLIKDRQEFYNAVAAAGVEGKLKAGNFIIPSDATPAEVISIITN